MRPRGRSIALLLALVTPLVLAAGADAQISMPLGEPSSTPASVSDDYRIGPEDVLDISVWKNTELTQTVQVRPDGKISLPLVNDVQAAGLTPMQLRDALVKGYATYFTEPEISVGVKEVRSLKVSVLGMVKMPGRYDLKSRVTVLEALALAGGFAEFAKRDRIFVSRRNETGVTRLRFDYVKVLDGDDKENFLLLPGDIIVVP